MTHTTMPELLPCPFCGCAMTVRSNRDWHRLHAETEHGDDCIWSGDDDAVITAPATDAQLAAMIDAWNRRTAIAAVGGQEKLAKTFEQWYAENGDPSYGPLAYREGWDAALGCVAPQPAQPAPGPAEQAMEHPMVKAAKTNFALAGQVNDLAMLARRLVHALNHASPGNAIAKKTADYLMRNDLQGTTLRAEDALRDAPWQPTPQEQAISLEKLDAAFETEIARISTLEYNSNAVCRQFYANLRERIVGALSPATSERDSVVTKRQLGIGAAIERACLELPAGVELNIELESGSGTVRLYLPICGDGPGCVIHEWDADTFGGKINLAIDVARAAQEKE